MARRITSKNELIVCPYCGEKYSVTYKHCPFCNEDGTGRWDDPAPEDHEYQYASSLKLMAAINAEQMDVVLMNQEGYDIFSQRGYLLDLSGLLTSDGTLYRRLEPHLAVNTVILEDNSIEYTLNQAEQYRAVTEEVVNGLDLSQFPLFQGAGFSEPVYLGVVGNSPRLPAVVQYIAYLAS